MTGASAALPTEGSAEAGSAATPAVSPRRARRPWSDFAGSAAFIALAVWLMVTAPVLSLAVIPTFAYELLFAAAFLTRGRARATLSGWGPYVAALVGTFLIPVTMAVANVAAPRWVASVAQVAPRAAGWVMPIGALLIFAGVIVSMWGLWYLRASISLVPAVRGLVTTGPYRIARHPLYLAYILSYAGFTILHPTLAVVIAMVVWLVATVARVRYEERLLSAAFPEYAEYRARVGAFGPKMHARV